LSILDRWFPVRRGLERFEGLVNSPGYALNRFTAIDLQEEGQSLMKGENTERTSQHCGQSAANPAQGYDPFVRGPFPVGVRTIHAHDPVRDRRFLCEIWYPADERHAGQDLAPATQDVFVLPSRDVPRSQMAVRDAVAPPGTYPLIIYSHPSGAQRRAATFLCTHLSSHGYAVAALDHSETFASELKGKAVETAEQRTARVEATIASRVPDIRFLLDHLLGASGWNSEGVVDDD
jgi:predicted dienelactone hydrolase